MGIHQAASLLISRQDAVGGVMILVQNPGVPNDGGEVPFDRAGESIFPVRPEQSEGGMQQIARMGIAMQRLMRNPLQRRHGGNQM